MNAIAQNTTAPNQINQFAVTAVTIAQEEFRLSSVGTQYLIKNEKKFVDAIRTATLVALKDFSVTDEYKNEQVPVVGGYVSGYAPNSLIEQATCLKRFYPKLKDVNAVDLGESPRGSEGVFIIPNIWKEDSPLEGSYIDNLRVLFKLLEENLNLSFTGGMKLDPDCYRQLPCAEAALKQISKDQGHPDILVIAAQFGLAYGGCSGRRARVLMADQSQFPLGVFVIGIMLLTHPNRLQNYKDLSIDCAGDEFDDPNDSDRFNKVLCFEVSEGEVECGTNWIDEPNGYSGSPSGFILQ